MNVREFLKKVNQEHGWDVDDFSLAETLIDYGTVVHRSGQDQHRWYICQTAVTEIDGTFIAFTDYIITGDNSMSDMDLHYDLDAAKIVERKERTITEVYYE